MSSITMPKPRRYADVVDHLPRLREMLEEHRRFRLDQLNQLTSQYEATPGQHIDTLDASADNARVEVTAAVEAAARQALDDIDAALARIATGQYGDCTECHAPIPVDRLLAIPQAPLCMDCQRRAEHRR
ncbi:TraR/DksA family transcriptional regulator [Planosporangium sp. 12N6]|uniref:TraR/DksA family transcriptional regulator n=1 Tax=Planosporangium spinosum TaxID=3402278 RepID=UPI003CF6DDD6